MPYQLRVAVNIHITEFVFNLRVCRKLAELFNVHLFVYLLIYINVYVLIYLFTGSYIIKMKSTRFKLYLLILIYFPLQ